MAHVLASELRKAVLQAAFEGKLTNCDKSDSSVREFLKQNSINRSLLESKKEIKKDKIVQINHDEEPFEIPETWEWVRLNELYSILNGDRGKNYPSKSKLSKTGNIPFISALNLNGKNVNEDDNLLYLDEQQYNLLNAGKLKKNDIVMCIRGSLGKHGVFQFDKGAIASSLVIIRPISNSVNTRYLFYYLDSELLQAEIRKYDNGTAQPNLSADNLKKFLFPLPPIEEQARIVARVDELMAKIDEYEKLENELVELKKNFPGDMKAAVLQAAMQGKLTEQLISDSEVYRELLSTKNYPRIEELYDLPDNWINAHLEDLTNSIATKQYQILEKDVCKEGKYPVISQSKEYSIGFTNNEERVFNPSSKIVLFGDHTTIVKTIDYPFVVGADGVKLFECTNFILPEYLYYVLTFNSSLISEVGGYSRHYKYLKNKSIPLPPIEEQKRIVEKLDKILPLCEELEKEVD